ncbi:ribose 5-phosphate isomerase A [Caldivirga maquilingensis]|uniref:Ribose-5-phosphate isomerase A n=1 Tax=Caldivirga maquilingensis (strain ATCC 700844 / DSM 13496 / JCM 10307 / IC-167) TaxID=397948 RepID=A8MCS2_CALMQ|nr:ribose 5-phosphate isomerase A [Caldivirga maquilingensis]ABW01578.1 ribose 5-phosphate isomerase [Caldivirga maquilingensis IC-167]
MDPKLAAAKAALKYVRSGYVIGVGSGSTALMFLSELAENIEGGGLTDVKLIATSTETEYEIVKLGLGELLRYPWQVDHVDVAIDGADEVDKDKNLVKGGGGALTREKIIDYWASEFIVIVDESKLVDKIPSKHPIPVEVVPYAWPLVKARLERDYGGSAELRYSSGKRGPVITDNGNYIIDYRPGSGIEPREGERVIKCIPGVVEVGLFNGLKVSRVIVGKQDGSVNEF